MEATLKHFTRIAATLIFKQQEKAKGAAGNPGGPGAPIVRSDDPTTHPPTLRDLGISKQQSSDWQRLEKHPPPAPGGRPAGDPFIARPNRDSHFLARHYGHKLNPTQRALTAITTRSLRTSLKVVPLSIINLQGPDSVPTTATRLWCWEPSKMPQSGLARPVRGSARSDGERKFTLAMLFHEIVGAGEE